MGPRAEVAGGDGMARLYLAASEREQGAWTVGHAYLVCDVCVLVLVVPDPGAGFHVSFLFL